MRVQDITTTTNGNGHQPDTYRIHSPGILAPIGSLGIVLEAQAVADGEVKLSRAYTRRLTALGYLHSIFPDLPHAVIERLLSGEYRLVTERSGAVIIEVSLVAP
jgi:hypothetical protein